MIRLVVATAAAGLVLLAGCGGEASTTSEPSRTTTSAPPEVLTATELRAALPRTSQVPGARKKMFTCPGTDGCEKGVQSVGMSLEPSLTGEQVKARYGAYVLPEDAHVSAFVWDDAAAAEEAVEKARDEEQAFVGRFATKGEQTSDTSYTFGEKGTGTIEDLTVDGWTGYIARREQVLTNTAGDTDSGPVARTEIHLANGNGNASLKVLVLLLDDESSPSGSEKLARRLVEDYLSRLGNVASSR